AALVLLTMVPLVALQLHQLDSRQTEQIEAAKHRVLFLARLASEKQNDLAQQARNLVDFVSGVDVLQGDDIAACNAFLKSLTDRHAWITSLRVATPGGDSICRNTDLARATNNLGSMDFFQAAVATKSFAQSGYRIGSTSKRPIIAGAG